ncbi:hypothetical protein ANO11243_029610 [Dothideomycetidae sp. 11243]|nr:hypothetical protein ANO11243_029610 [fungal sp. No.11243]
MHAVGAWGFSVLLQRLSTSVISWWRNPSYRTKARGRMFRHDRPHQGPRLLSPDHKQEEARKLAGIGLVLRVWRRPPDPRRIPRITISASWSNAQQQSPNGVPHEPGNTADDRGDSAFARCYPKQQMCGGHPRPDKNRGRLARPRLLLGFGAGRGGGRWAHWNEGSISTCGRRASTALPLTNSTSQYTH